MRAHVQPAAMAILEGTTDVYCIPLSRQLDHLVSCHVRRWRLFRTQDKMITVLFSLLLIAGLFIISWACALIDHYVYINHAWWYATHPILTKLMIVVSVPSIVTFLLLDGVVHGKST